MQLKRNILLRTVNSIRFSLKIIASSFLSNLHNKPGVKIEKISLNRKILKANRSCNSFYFILYRFVIPFTCYKNLIFLYFRLNIFNYLFKWFHFITNNIITIIINEEISIQGWISIIHSIFIYCSAFASFEIYGNIFRL